MNAGSKTYLSKTETAKLLRKALKAEFPGQKFSVRCTNGSSIRVGWTDGPTSADVQAVTSLYNGATFDGMQDLREYHDSILVDEDGTPQVVHFGADFIFTEREISQKWRDVIARQIEKLSGQPCDLDDWRAVYPVCVFEGKLSRYAGTESGSTLLHQYTQNRRRINA